MRIITEQLTATGVLTGYLLDASPEMATATTRPAVLVLPGGGYEFCSDREAEPVAAAYLAEGFHAFVLRYAVGPHAPWEASFTDAGAALDWLRDHARELGVQPDQVAVVGFSAGGHLAASLGVAAPKRPNALVLGYPVTIAEPGDPLGKPILDIVGSVDAAMPPTFVFSTFADSLVPVRHSTMLLTAMAEHHVPFEAHIYLLGEHGLSLASPLTANGRAAAVEPAVAGWLADSVRFLQRIFDPFPVAGEAASYADLQRRGVLGLDMPLGRLAAHPAALAVLRRQLGPSIDAVAANPFAAGLSLRELAAREPALLPDSLVDAVAADLASLSAGDAPGGGV